MNGSLDISVLRALVTVAETGGFTAAARKLYQTQAAVSGQIKRLEEQLGTRLFTRCTRGVLLTADGEKLLGFARAMLGLNEQAVRHFSLRRSVERVRIGIPEGYVVQFLAGAIELLMTEEEPASIEVECDHSPALLQKLDDGELDLVIATQQSERQDGELLARVGLAWAGTGLFERKPDAHLQLSLYPAGVCAHRAMAIQTLDRHRIAWRVLMSSSHLETVLLPVKAGLAVTVLPKCPLPEGMIELPPRFNLPALPCAGVMLHADPQLGRAATKLRAILLDLHDRSAPVTQSRVSSTRGLRPRPVQQCDAPARLVPTLPDPRE